MVLMFTKKYIFMDIIYNFCPTEKRTKRSSILHSLRRL